MFKKKQKNRKKLFFLLCTVNHIRLYHMDLFLGVNNSILFGSVNKKKHMYLTYFVGHYQIMRILIVNEYQTILINWLTSATSQLPRSTPCYL
jgi:hypothetical protein